jgi:FecR protein
MRPKNKISYLTLLLILTAGAAIAQPADPPSRVARLNYLNGQVSFRPGTVQDWAAATLNYPLTTGDHLWTDPGAQTEMHVGSTAIRMGSETALSFLNLDNRSVQLSLTGGSLNVHIRSMRPDEVYEVDTPNSSVALHAGDYRINVDGDNNATVVVTNTGEADIAGDGANFPVYPRQMAHITGTDRISQEITPVPPPDAFDSWCMERERREASMVSARYVPRDMIGYEDLDAYGVWRNVPPYGWVWTPTNVPAGWAPYREGHWAWVEPWGWTWIDDEPWGFAPFHYGRWAFIAGAWSWVPGRLDPMVRPVYAPALVAFVGGPRFGVSIGVGGGVGMAAWFALGPGEVYRPAYAVSPAYVTQINIVHVTDVAVINRVDVVNLHYVNQGVTGAVIAVPHDAFEGARPVAAVAVHVDAREVVEAPVMMHAAVVPVRASVLAGPARTNVPPARFAEARVVMKSTPPPPPVSFAAKQRALEANGGRPLEPAAVNNLRASEPAHNDRPVMRTPETRSEAPTAMATEERRSEPARNERKPANKKATKK